MRQCLLLFSIGPVKGFVDNSRKMRDMYAGSFLLSYLMGRTLDYLKKQYGDRAEVVLPCREMKTEAVNIPNRFAAVIGCEGEEEKTEIGRKLQNYVKQELSAAAKKIFPAEAWTPAMAQIERFLEVYWVFEDMPCKEDYPCKYNEAVDKLNAVKQLRLFSQNTETADRKCSLYESLNALFVRNGSKPAYLSPEAYSVKQGYDLKLGETLSAPAYLKRMLYRAKLEGYDADIISVAYMLLKSRVPEEYRNALEELKDVAETIFDQANGQKLTTQEYSKELIPVAEKLYLKLEEDRVSLSPYYAIVKLDGDNVGSLYRTCAGIDSHKTLSGQIQNFAEAAKEIFKAHHGVCIFAGGEDVLGFLPLETLFAAVMSLHQKFQDTVMHPNGEKLLTLSAGIVITHLMMPLKGVMERLEEMERAAKGMQRRTENGSKEKNAFAIQLVKRAGESLVVKNGFGDSRENWKLLQNTVKALSENVYSGSFISQLSLLLHGLREKECCEKMVRALIKKALLQSRATASAEDFYKLFAAFENDVAAFLDALQMARFLAREV